MSLAQFNGIASNSILSVASIGFPDGSSLSSGSIASSILSQPSTSLNVGAGTYTVATFPSVPAGIYYFASSYSVSSTSNITTLNYYVETPSTNLINFTYQIGTGTSGYYAYVDTFSGIINVSTTTDVVVKVQFAGTGSPIFNAGQTGSNPLLLVRLI